MNNNHVVIISYPYAQSFLVPLSNLEKNLSSLFRQVTIIVGEIEETSENATINGIPIIKNRVPFSSSTFLKLFYYFYLQSLISYYLIKNFKKLDCCLFFGEGLIIPIIICRVIHFKVIICLTGFSGFQKKHQISKKEKIIKFFSEMNLSFSNMVILYSNKIIAEYNLAKWKDKIAISHEHFIDTTLFRNSEKIGSRKNIIGYIGRFSEEKGILNFIAATRLLVSSNDDIMFLVAGKGYLNNQIVHLIRKNPLSKRIELINWIQHEELPQLLNKIRLLVIPSFTEGLPNIMLEAMACETPVLATSVGAIPDIIKDGETGFIMNDNTPECIAKNILRVLNHQNLQQIADNGRQLVEEEFVFEKTAESWKAIFSNILIN